MASASESMVPSKEGVHPKITVIVPTLERASLAEAISTLQAQTLKPEKILVMKGSEDVVSKIRKGLAQTETQLVAIGDDDIVYPKQWLEAMANVMQSSPDIGFVGGTMLPMSQIKPAGESEKLIAFVLGSFFGTSNMSQRVKMKHKVEKRDETNLVGAGLVKTELIKKIFAAEEIIPSFHDTWMLYRINQLGFKTMYAPDAYFYHATRKNIFTFALQMLRVGSGRMGFFRHYPREAIKKPHILVPMFFTIYIFAFLVLNWFNIAVISGIPLIAYILIDLLVTFFEKGHWKLSIYYFVMHFSYGLGELLGLIRSVRTWK